MRTLHSPDIPILHLPDAHPSLRQAIRFPPWIYKLRPSRGYCIISAYFQSSAAFICLPFSFPLQDPVQFSTFYTFAQHTTGIGTSLSPLRQIAKGVGKTKRSTFSRKETLCTILRTHATPSSDAHSRRSLFLIQEESQLASRNLPLVYRDTYAKSSCLAIRRTLKVSKILET